MKRGKIVLTPFPFTDLTKNKGGCELKVMVYELPSALADGKIADKIIGFS